MIKWRGSDHSDGSSSVPATTAAEIYPPGVKSPLELTSNETALDYVRNAREKMGMLARMRFDKSTQRELQQIAGSIAVNYLAAQKEIMLAKIVAGVGIAQREIFKDFLTRAIEQDKDLLERTNHAQKDMTNMIEKEVLLVLEEKKTKFDEAKVKFDSGKLLENDYKGLCDVYNQAAEKLITDKFDRMDKITQSYLEHFEHAVKKYREKAIQIGGVIS